jgi:hypothetical protein
VKRYRVTFRFHYNKSPNTHLVYQQYILQGFKQLPQVEIKIRPLPFAVPVFLDTMNCRRTGLAQVGRLLKFAKGRLNYRAVDDHVGRYEITDLVKGITRKVAVDASDGRSIRDPSAHAWANVYFKTNFWPGIKYGPKVRPLINGDGYLSKETIRHLVGLRNTKKSMDLVYWTRLWGMKPTSYGREAHQNIIEHQIRLYEALSNVQCKKSLAVNLAGSEFYGPERETIVKRLKAAGAAGVPLRLSPAEFWNKMASSKIAFTRPGDHLCMSFRICSFLNIGACIMYDGEPFTRCYRPLIRGEHYEHGACRMGSDFTLPNEDQYNNLTEKIQMLLGNEEKMDHMRHEAAQYFDRYANPVAVARHILETS